MKATRQDKLGIKQTIRKAWMDKTVQMMLAGYSEKDIRAELDAFLSTQKQSGGTGERGKQTYICAIGMLSAWFAPAEDLRPLRDDALRIAATVPSEKWLPLHWCVISASYPFWFQVAKQVGRLLSLQDQITQRQIFQRIAEQYGDRQTVARNARYAVRSFVAWDVLFDAKTKGCYEKSVPVSVKDPQVSALMIESALLALPESQTAMGSLVNHPAFFPFQLPLLTDDLISQQSSRIEVMRYGLDDINLALIKAR